MKMLTVVAEDRPGLMVEITSVLEEAGIEIVDFAGQTLAGTAVLNLRAEPLDEAFRRLSAAGFRVVSHDHVLVRLENHPGALGELSRLLAEARIDVRGMHIVGRQQAASIVALETPDADRARDVLGDRLVQDPTADLPSLD